MKKILVAVMAMIAVTFSACSNGSNTPVEGSDSDSVAAPMSPEERAEENVDQDLSDLIGELEEDVNSKQEDAVNSNLDAFKARIQALINAGNKEDAQKYIDALKKYVEEHKTELSAVSSTAATNAQSTLSDVVSKLESLPSDVKESAKSAAEDVANQAVETGKAKVEEAKTAAKTAVQNKANEAVESAKTKANDAINKAASDVKGKLGL